jgi:hypothetical protein
MSDEIILVGDGEFQIRDVHVVAKVKITDGLVQEVEFYDGDNGEIAEATQVQQQLRGQAVSSALEVKAEEFQCFDSLDESGVQVALFEALHRAIEACLDDE